MAKNPITVIEESKQELSALNQVLTSTNTLILEISANTRKVGKDFFNVKNPKQANDALAKRASAESKVLTLIREKEKINKRLAAGEAKIAVAMTSSNKQLAQQRFELQELNRRAKQAAVLSSSLSTEYQKQSVRLIQLRTKYKDVALTQGESSKAARVLQREIQKLDLRLKSVDGNVGQFQRSVGNYGKALNGAVGAAKKMAGALGLMGGAFLAIRIGRDAIKVIKDFDKANATLASVLQLSREETRGLADDAQRLGSITVKTAQEVTELQTAYARLGFNQTEIIDLTEATIQGSIALNSELGATAELTGALVNTFDEFGTNDAPQILDILSLATAKSALNFQKLQAGLPIVAGAANAAGVPFTKLVALLGKLSDAGIDVSSSSTALRNIFIEAASQGLNYEQILDKIKSSQDKLTASNDEFGKRAAVSATVLAANIAATNELDVALQNAAGTAQSMADKELDTLDGALQLLKSAWQGFILGADGSTGAAAKLKSGIQFLAANLDRILKVIIFGTKAWVAYKTALLLANVQSRIFALTASQTAAAATAQAAAQTANAAATTAATTAWQRFNLALKANIIGILIGLAIGLYTAIQSLYTSLEDSVKATDEATRAFLDHEHALKASANSTNTLLDRYDELTKKQKENKDGAKLTTAEQKDLDGIIVQLAKDYPKATGEIDKNTGALIINTEQIRNNLAAQAGDINSAQKKAQLLKENTNELNLLEMAQERLNKTEREGEAEKIDNIGFVIREEGKLYKAKFQAQTKSFIATRELSVAEIDAVNAAVDGNRELIATKKDFIRELNGEKTSKQINNELTEIENNLKAESKKLTDEEIDVVAKYNAEIEKQTDILKKLRAPLQEEGGKINPLDEQGIKDATKALNNAKAALKEITGTTKDKDKDKDNSAGKRTIDYQYKIDEESLEQAIAADEEIATAIDNNLKDRLKGLEDFEAKSKELVDLRKTKEKEDVKSSVLSAKAKAKALEYIELKYKVVYTKIQEDKQKIAEKIIKDSIDAAKDFKTFEETELRQANEKELQIRKDAYVKAIEAAGDNKEALKKVEDEYTADILEIKLRQELAILAQKKKFLEAQLKFVVDPKKRKLIAQQIAGIEIAMSTLKTDSQIKDLKRLRNAQQEIDDFKRDSLAGASTVLANTLNIDANNLNIFLQGVVDGFDSALEGISAAALVAGDIVNAVFEAKIAMYDQDIEKNKAYYDALLDNEELTDKQRTALEDRKAAKEAILEKKKRAARKKQAVYDKLFGVLQVGISTAVGIQKAIASFPLTAGQPWVSIIAALGAIQTAAILSQPIPNYATGRDGGKAEYAYVGDGGRSEIIEKPNKDIYVTPNNPTLTYLGKGDKVHTSPQAYLDSVSDKELYNNIHKHVAIGNLQGQTGRYLSNSTGANNKEIVKAIEKNKASVKVINNNNIGEELNFIFKLNSTL